MQYKNLIYVTNINEETQAIASTSSYSVKNDNWHNSLQSET